MRGRGRWKRRAMEAETSLARSREQVLALQMTCIEQSKVVAKQDQIIEAVKPLIEAALVLPDALRKVGKHGRSG